MIQVYVVEKQKMSLKKQMKGAVEETSLGKKIKIYFKPFI